MIYLRRGIQLPVVDTNSPLRREARLDLLALVVHGHHNSCLLGNHVHGTNPLAILYGIDDLCIKPLRISSFTASHTLGFNRRWASLTGLDSSSKNMRWVHNEGSNPLKSARVQPISCSFRRNTSSNRFSYSSLSWEEMIIGLTCWESRKAYLSVDGRGLSSYVGSSKSSSWKSASSLIVMTSSMQVSMSWSSKRPMALKSLKACEGYFISLLMLTFTMCSLTLRITFPFPQYVTAFAIAKKGLPRIIGAWLSS